MKMEAALVVSAFLHLSMLLTVNCKLKKGHFWATVYITSKKWTQIRHEPQMIQNIKLIVLLRLYLSRSLSLPPSVAVDCLSGGRCVETVILQLQLVRSASEAQLCHLHSARS